MYGLGKGLLNQVKLSVFVKNLTSLLYERFLEDLW